MMNTVTAYSIFTDYIRVVTEEYVPYLIVNFLRFVTELSATMEQAYTTLCSTSPVFIDNVPKYACLIILRE
jgi:hypothetical protein